jgi:hydroxymethylbilane synthase
MAGLRRLDLADRVTAVLEADVMLPAVAQGAIGIETRGTDAVTNGLLAPLNCANTALRVTAERGVLTALDGSCRTPIAALARVLPDGSMDLEAMALSPDGRTIVTTSRRFAATDARAAGLDAGAELKGRLPPGIFTVS